MSSKWEATAWTNAWISSKRPSRAVAATQTGGRRVVRRPGDRHACAGKLAPKEHRSQADLSLGPDGRFLLANGLAEFGNGSMNVIRQIAAQILGVRAAEVETIVADTDRTPYDDGMFASGFQRLQQIG